MAALAGQGRPFRTPNRVWHLYRIITTVTIGSTKYWLDYPSLGYNADGYVVSGNLFDLATSKLYAGIEFATLPKAPMLTGGSVTASYFRDPGNIGSAQVADSFDPSVAPACGLRDTEGSLWAERGSVMVMRCPPPSTALYIAG